MLMKGQRTITPNLTKVLKFPPGIRFNIMTNADVNLSATGATRFTYQYFPNTVSTVIWKARRQGGLRGRADKPISFDFILEYNECKHFINASEIKYMLS